MACKPAQSLSLMAEADHLVEKDQDDQDFVRVRPLVQRGQIHLLFRLGREPQLVNRSTRVIMMIFKAIFCSLGLWGHQWWNCFPRVLFVTICVAQSCYQLSIDLKCPFFDCNFDQKHLNLTLLKVFPGTQKTCFSLFSIAALLSYIVFIICFYKRKDSALLSPSGSMMKDGDKTEIIWLFLAFVGIASSLLSGLALFLYCELWSHINRDSFSIAYIIMVGIMILLAHWAAVNTCHAFAISSSSLGTLAKDALRLIQNVQNGTLDDVIRIHEDLCTVVFDTVSAYSVWFVLHWFTYGAGVVVHIILISEEFLEDKGDISTAFKAYTCVLFVCFLYVFILPCVSAARITSACARIYEEINWTTSDHWNEGHPFKDRRNIFLFISYAKDRRCGFRVGRITFNTSLAWFSFFFGLTGLLYRLFHGT